MLAIRAVLVEPVPAAVAALAHAFAPCHGRSARRAAAGRGERLAAEATPQHDLGDRLLASSGPSLQLLAARDLEVLQTLALPADFDGVDVFGLSPDRRHLAVARGADVRILAIE